MKGTSVVVKYQTFPSGKKYLFLQDGKQRIFLRNILFIKHASKPKEIVVVREWGATTNKGQWEPPKGQMEWKEVSEEIGAKSGQSVPTEKMVECMKQGVLREVFEEAKIHPNELRNIRMMTILTPDGVAPLSYTEAFPQAGPHCMFRYQFWEATLSDLRPAQTRLRKLTQNPDWVSMLPEDLCEKNAVAWWNIQSIPTRDWIRGEFSGRMVDMYMDFVRPKHI
jgi:hypothetical protein